MRRFWTESERSRLRELYPSAPARVVARRLRRSVKAVYLEAWSLGLSKVVRADTGGDFVARLKSCHADGLTDPLTAARLGCERHTVAAWRRKLGLPSNRGSAAYRGRVAAATRGQVARAGLGSLADVRALAFATRAVRQGWPAAVRPREAQILAALERGPLTRPELAAAIGVPWKGSRKSLTGNVPGGSYLAHLTRLGLVVSLGRVVRGGGKGRSLQLYSLALTAERKYPHAVTETSAV